MPIYTYRCECGKQFDRVKKMVNYKEPETCECGKVAEKILTPIRIATDYPGYECPVTGDWIEGRKAHEENLKRTGCRILEPGETEQNIKRQKAEEEAFYETVGETAAQIVAAMPPKKQEQLASELASGASLAVERTTVAA